MYRTSEQKRQAASMVCGDARRFVCIMLVGIGMFLALVQLFALVFGAWSVHVSNADAQALALAEGVVLVFWPAAPTASATSYAPGMFVYLRQHTPLGVVLTHGTNDGAECVLVRTAGAKHAREVDTCVPPRDIVGYIVATVHSADVLELVLVGIVLMLGCAYVAIAVVQTIALDLDRRGILLLPRAGANTE